MGQAFKQGDKVEWNTPQGKTTGTVQKRVTTATKVDGTELKGTEDNPVYIVKSEKTGKRAGHKAGALSRRARGRHAQA